jgi:hypothetical protein
VATPGALKHWEYRAAYLDGDTTLLDNSQALQVSVTGWRGFRPPLMAEMFFREETLSCLFLTSVS